MRRSGRRDGGFTLVELLVVMIILGIIVAVTLPVMNNQRRKAAETSARSDLRSAVQLVLAAKVDGSYAVARDLNAANFKYRASENSMVTVLYATAEDFCIISTNSRGRADDSGRASALGVGSTRLYYAAPSTGVRPVTASDTGCTTSSSVSTSNGWWNSGGYQDGAISSSAY